MLLSCTMTAKEAMFCTWISLFVFLLVVSLILSTKLDAEKRLALQEEKQELETKLLEV